jgi:hypothetical protein
VYEVGCVTSVSCCCSDDTLYEVSCVTSESCFLFVLTVFSKGAEWPLYRVVCVMTHCTKWAA